VEQKGSAVHSRSLRFDFSHFAKLTDEEIHEVEQFVNSRIQERIPLEEERNVPLETAQRSGAIMLFGEKYGDTVRTVKFGKSMELCGGTHVRNTSDIWHFKILSEGAIASGIRRIEAITNAAVRDYFLDQDKAYDKLKNALKNPSDVLKTVQSLQEENSRLRKEVEQLNRLKTSSVKNDLLDRKEQIGGINFIASLLDMDAASMKGLAFELGGELDDLFFIGGSEVDGKALLTVYISKELVDSRGLNAGSIVRELGKHIQGGGGGQPFFATAGGKNPSGLKTALEQAKNYLQ
jgi:alanyl-tRNA synthetase